MTLKLIPALLVSLLFQNHALASDDFGSHYLPIQESVRGELPQITDYSSANKGAPSEVRVKIFPHNNEKYNAPAGEDKIWDRVTFKTSGLCKTYKAEDDNSKNPRHAEQATSSGKVLKFAASTLPYAMWIKCSEPAQLIRVGYERKIIRYPGKFFIKRVRTANRPAYLTVINVVSESQYLKGVVPAEMPASWPFEALKVQAVAARTYFRYELSTNVAASDKNIVNEDAGAQLDDTVMYQAYLGIHGQDSTDRAVEATANEVMTHKGSVIKAYFSADSGGHTENAENVWGVYLPYCLGKPEPYPDGAVSISHWTVSKSLRDLQQSLKAKDLITGTQAIASLSITEHYPHGRVKGLSVRFVDGTRQNVSGLDFAHAVGLRSNWFSLGSKAAKIEIKGRGFGHGVGMNQWGSRVLVSGYGRSYHQILNYYYSDIQIETIAR
jgi:SpoIID/LytB domain protein